MTTTERFLIDENRRLLCETRLLREWLFEALSGGDEARRARMEQEFDAQVKTQLGNAQEAAEHLQHEAIMEAHV